VIDFPHVPLPPPPQTPKHQVWALQGFGQQQAWGGPQGGGQGYGAPQEYGFANFGPPGQPRPQEGYGQRPTPQHQAPSSQVQKKKRG
jgi:hypothetical protein